MIKDIYYVLDLDTLDNIFKLKTCTWLKGFPNSIQLNPIGRYLALCKTDDGYYLFGLDSLDKIKEDYNILRIKDFLNKYKVMYKNMIDNNLNSMNILIDTLIDETEHN